MKKYAQLEYSFTNAEIDLQSREALRKQFNNVPQHWFKRMSRYNWKIIVVDELIGRKNGNRLTFKVDFQELSIFLNSSSCHALKNGVYKVFAGYIIAQHMTIEDSIVFSMLLEENCNEMQEFFKKRNILSTNDLSLIFIELFSFVIETKGKNPFIGMETVYRHVKRWVTGEIFERNLKDIPDYIIVGNDVVDENIFKLIEYFSELPLRVQKCFIDSGWKIRISSEYLLGTADCEGYCDIAEKKIYFRSAPVQFRNSIWHEIGHFIDYQCGFLSKSQYFSETYKREKGYLMRENISYEFYQYCTMNEHEYFAESFSFYMKDPYKLRMSAPLTYNFIDDIVR